MLRKIFGFFSAAPEQERIAALEANHRPAFAGLADQQIVDLFLTRTMLAQGLAHENLFSRRLGQR